MPCHARGITRTRGCVSVGDDAVVAVAVGVVDNGGGWRPLRPRLLRS